MKRIIIPLCMIILVVTSLALARVTVVMLSGSSGGSPCTTPSTGDELNEGFLGAGYENTWTESGTGSTIDEDASLSGSPPTPCCSEGLKVELVSGSAHTYWDRGTTISYTTNTDIVLYLYFETLSFDTDYESCAILIWDNDTTHATWSYGTGFVELVKDSSSSTGYYLRGHGSSTGSGIEVTTGSWYKIQFHLDSTATSSYLQVDDGIQDSFTRADVNSQYLSIGTEGVETGDSLKFYVGYVYVDTP